MSSSLIVSGELILVLRADVILPEPTPGYPAWSFGVFSVLVFFCELVCFMELVSSLALELTWLILTVDGLTLISSWAVKRSITIQLDSDSFFLRADFISIGVTVPSILFTSIFYLRTDILDLLLALLSFLLSGSYSLPREKSSSNLGTLSLLLIVSI